MLDFIVKYGSLILDGVILIVLYRLFNKLEVTQLMLFEATKERKAIYDQVNKEAKIVEDIQRQAKRRITE